MGENSYLYEKTNCKLSKFGNPEFLFPLNKHWAFLHGDSVLLQVEDCSNWELRGLVLAPV